MEEKRILQMKMSFIYRLMVASESLLSRACERMFHAYPEQQGLRDYLADHSIEEAGHADMLADDLKNLGVDPIPKFHLAELMAGSQYYLIEHEHPAALLGYMAALENDPTPIEVIDQWEAQYGPLKCLRLHAERDPIHGPEVLKQIEALPDELKSLAQINMLRTLDQLKAAPGIIFAGVAKDGALH